MTAPPASRHRIAVSSSRCSSGWGFRRRARAARLGAASEERGGLAIHASFDARARTPSSDLPDSSAACRQRPEVAAALLEGAVLVVGRARRRQQYDVALARRAAGSGDRVLEVA